MIDLAYINETEQDIDYEKQFQDILLYTLDLLDIDDDIEMSVILVDDTKIHHINKEYRNIDKSTDVISFASEDLEDIYIEGMPRNIGDIFISVEHAYKQSKEYQHSMEREMCFLFTHGLLHLLGYDHMNEDDEKTMFSMQDRILEGLHITRGGKE